MKQLQYMAEDGSIVTLDVSVPNVISKGYSISSTETIANRHQSFDHPTAEQASHFQAKLAKPTKLEVAITAFEVLLFILAMSAVAFAAYAWIMS